MLAPATRRDRGRLASRRGGELSGAACASGLRVNLATPLFGMALMVHVRQAIDEPARRFV
jgi:hypothetical protein